MLFDNKKKTSKAKNIDSWETKLERTKHNFAWKLVLEYIKDDPDLELVFIAQKLGMEMPQIDNKARLCANIRAQLFEQTAELITNDPVVQRRYREKLIAEKISDIKRD